MRACVCQLLRWNIGKVIVESTEETSDISFVFVSCVKCFYWPVISGQLVGLLILLITGCFSAQVFIFSFRPTLEICVNPLEDNPPLTYRMT